MKSTSKISPFKSSLRSLKPTNLYTVPTTCSYVLQLLRERLHRKLLDRPPQVTFDIRLDLVLILLEDIRVDQLILLVVVEILPVPLHEPRLLPQELVLDQHILDATDNLIEILVVVQRYHRIAQYLASCAKRSINRDVATSRAYLRCCPTFDAMMNRVGVQIISICVDDRSSRRRESIRKVTC